MAIAKVWICGDCGTENHGKSCQRCAERSTNASIASNERWSREQDRALATAPARANGPGSIEYWMTKVDPDQAMTYRDRVRAAENAKRAFYARLGKSGRKARRANRTSA